MNSARRRILLAGGTAMLATSLSACGTILYPERKGQRNGRIDPSIAILDGIGLLLFLVPGVIAFAVDFSNGTIYLPGTQTSDASDDNIQTAQFKGELTEEKLDTAWNETYGDAKPFEVSQLERYPIRNQSDISSLIGHLSAWNYARG
ncbi:hypothetical protein HY29_04785 [Hyphomonas beringensis]|uniref:Uncharacterized protein n=1 Tax=Hyphomonas beringensis TaxID=1280946 RepID=A0A062U7I8_9PROT|nr:hypothetical protein [Hyphomonas beringensis]KCZ52599.1 hypothetical protein HY29_04785 [Hyphomonas beringensis]